MPPRPNGLDIRAPQFYELVPGGPRTPELLWEFDFGYYPAAEDRQKSARETARPRRKGA